VDPDTVHASSPDMYFNTKAVVGNFSRFVVLLHGDKSSLAVRFMVCVRWIMAQRTACVTLNHPCVLLVQNHFCCCCCCMCVLRFTRRVLRSRLKADALTDRRSLLTFRFLRCLINSITRPTVMGTVSWKRQTKKQNKKAVVGRRSSHEWACHTREVLQAQIILANNLPRVAHVLLVGLGLVGSEESANTLVNMLRYGQASPVAVAPIHVILFGVEEQLGSVVARRAGGMRRGLYANAHHEHAECPVHVQQEEVMENPMVLWAEGTVKVEPHAHNLFVA